MFIKKHHLALRYLREKLFHLLGLMSVIFAILMLFILLYSIFNKAISALSVNYMHFEINVVSNANYQDWNSQQLVAPLLETLRVQDIIITPEQLKTILSVYELKHLKHKLSIAQSEHQKHLNIDLLLTSDADMVLKGNRIADAKMMNLVNKLKQQDIFNSKFNMIFFTHPDSRHAELAGIKSAIIGSIYIILLTIIFAVVVSVGAAIYLEEFAPKNKITNFIEININNLASIPSIVFGLLGLLIFQQFFGIPRATPLLASLVLSLMVLPSIILTTRVALSSVPKTIRDSAYVLGSTKMQTIFYHLLPFSVSGILTGVIISISRAIGETAPLLMIGMVAYNSSVPNNIFSKATAVPVQILLWNDSPELGYVEKAALASAILLVFLLFVNSISIYLRYKFEKKN